MGHDPFGLLDKIELKIFPSLVGQTSPPLQWLHRMEFSVQFASPILQRELTTTDFMLLKQKGIQRAKRQNSVSKFAFCT